jgi:hypothetical protein
MSERETLFRAAVITYFPMFIAALSLITSIYNGYLNDKMVGIIQNNLRSSEYLRTCKEIIDSYFQVKLQAKHVAEHAGRAKAGTATGTATAANAGPNGGSGSVQVDAANAVSKFAALGTYLANLSEESVREPYTHLSWELEKVIAESETTPLSDVNKLFERADDMFATMNENCVKTAKQ